MKTITYVDLFPLVRRYPDGVLLPQLVLPPGFLPEDLVYQAV